MSGRVYRVYHISCVTISISLGDQTGSLENPQRLFVMFVEEVAQ
jgi:hypothetical protein